MRTEQGSVPSSGFTVPDAPGSEQRRRPSVITAAAVVLFAGAGLNEAQQIGRMIALPASIAISLGVDLVIAVVVGVLGIRLLQGGKKARTVLVLAAAAFMVLSVFITVVQISNGTVSIDRFGIWSWIDAGMGLLRIVLAAVLIALLTRPASTLYCDRRSSSRRDVDGQDMWADNVDHRLDRFGKRSPMTDPGQSNSRCDGQG
ncbi:hypothetical protein R8Z50_19970 [Longispora sp. K20-0274]|uniref:hypothetical protein n=1 Tax=Longispora sp. K20-0274 TaxID=3088255 RepID=UPI00399BC395